MRRTDIPATKSNLLRLKEDLHFVRAGHELLEQKREVLLEALVDTARESAQLRGRVSAGLAAAYAALEEAMLAGGRALLEAEALATVGTHSLRVRERSVMGVLVPLLDVEDRDQRPEPVAAPGWATPGAALVRRRIRGLLEALAHLAEIEVSCQRLAAELQRTQRKVNALEEVFIPEYRDTIHFIEAALEEREREALFQLKRLKGRSAAREEE